jgi:hypothetical protein
VYGVSEFSEYIELVGGEEKMRHLERLERLEVPFEAPWARRG